jgi:hypothetical protein
MMVHVKPAMAFVNSHAPTNAQVLFEDGVATKFFIMSEAVYPDGSVKWETDTIECKDGLVDLKKIEDILGY